MDFKFIKGYGKKYKVFRNGIVKRLKGNDYVPLISFVSNAGYVRVSLYDGGKIIKKSVHRLVAESFIPNPEDKPQVNHINGIKTDNRDCNLEWNTASENQKHAYKERLQLPVRGEKHGNSKLKECEVLEIFKLANDEVLGPNEIANKFEISRRTVSNIKVGDSWSHLTGKYNNKKVDIKTKKNYNNNKT